MRYKLNGSATAILDTATEPATPIWRDDRGIYLAALAAEEVSQICDRWNREHEAAKVS